MTTTTKPKEHLKHELIALHEKLSDSEKQKLMTEMKINFKDLPKIYIDDPAIAHMDVKVGDIIKVSRKSTTAKEINFYRGVIDA